MDGVKRIDSPKHYNGRDRHHINYITMHTGSPAGVDNVFTNLTSQASAHYGIGADGTIHQYVKRKNHGQYYMD